MNEEITKLLVPDRTFSKEANEVFARSTERLASCGMLIGQNAFVVEETTTGRIVDIGKISCGSKLCESCARKREAKEKNKLKAMIRKFKEETPKGRLALLTIGFAPMTHKMTTFYQKSAVELYLKEASIKRQIMKTFSENLARTANFLDGYFKAEELTVSPERFIRKELVVGNSLNIHWHILLFLNDKAPNYSEYEFSCWFFKKIFRGYLENCKKYRLKPALMRTPYVEKNLLKGAVVFEFEREGEEALEKYLTKSHWGLENELTVASRKTSKGLTVASLLSSKRKEQFKQNFMKFICLCLYNQRTFQYSKPKNTEKKVGKVEKSPVKSVKDIVNKFICEQKKEKDNFETLENVVVKKKKRVKSNKEPKKEKVSPTEYKPIFVVPAYAVVAGEPKSEEVSEEILMEKWLEFDAERKTKQKKKAKKPKIMLEGVIRGP